MAIATYDDYLEKVTHPYQRINDTKNSLASVAGRMSSLWATAPLGGVAPTTAAACDATFAGSMGQMNSSGVQRIAQVAASMGASGYLLICDRLSHQGGLVANINTTQTTNLGTAALTRYTSGAGVFLGLEIYTVVGTTLVNVTASYTNQANTSGQTTTATYFGSTGFREAGRMIVLPLASGDSGVRAVASVTLSATTGTAGSFGVTLFKPLFAMPIVAVGSQQYLFDAVHCMSCYMPEIVNNACLFYCIVTNSSATGILQNGIRIIEE